MKHWLLIAITALIVRGEWSNDPGNPVNLGTGIQPQIVSTSDGGAYVAWLTSGNFHIYLQRLDINGNPQWNTGGILVSDAPNSSWIAVYHMNLAVDAADNAIISSVDTRTGNWEVYVYKIDTAGTHVWNEDGLVLSSNGSENIAPRLLVEPSDTSIVVSWFESANNSSLHLQRISPAGEQLWGAGGLTVSTFNASLVSPQPALSSDGHILVQAIKQTGSFPALSSQVILQKYALDGTAQWNAWLPLADPVGFPLGNWLQDIQPDLQGGAFSSWTEMTSQNQTGKIQSVGDTGSLDWAFPTEASTSENNFRVSPRLTPANDGSGVYAVWGESDAAQINRGILAQLIDTTGTRQWGDGGLAVESMGSSSFLDINADELDEDLLLSYIRQYSLGTMDIFASRLETDGSFVWDTERVPVTNSATEKSDLSMTRGPSCAFLTWSEAGSIKAHCLLDNGSLGIPGETPQDTLNYFPLMVNSGVVLASEIDTTTFIIVYSTNINGNVYYAFDTYYPGESINQFRVDGNQVKVWDGTDDAVLYDISVPINTTWEFNVGDHSSEITFISRGDTIETGLGVYENCFCFHRFIGADYEYYDWLAEDGGLVQRDVVTIAGTRRYIMIDVLLPVAIEEEKPSTTPGNFQLNQNYPNPFNPSTRIQYELPEQAEISVAIYDVNGTQVIELLNGVQEAGNHILQWHAVNEGGAPVPSGVYFCRVNGLGLTQTIKMVLLR
ncbi:MAG: T9SS type A sorting domain-containing protein [FCB group bacterium]|nr:T9SS type A sorting domain-containing protein [FCB group bacterium]MBL7029388.1 T9SS type A sorting domain-containing protein [Candidatus Neomarinimicrobiota bacterium]MBL7123110.1 T9SS type A sorting domain-containing protein [Candidatus Neomarinimicrobiota bacterium]